ncbi:hypothetical protein IHE45_19G066900 [Dioscorea alata]|uniref:Uncharacterized protein n=1 Tax=Dioscorea alata TaxID=55571 RepID=A0ACB7TYT6_DIOAL|nr:hypothetical protein IHE45_19G066900 [Dioscorea alata]
MCIFLLTLLFVDLKSSNENVQSIRLDYLLFWRSGVMITNVNMHLTQIGRRNGGGEQPTGRKPD